MGRIQELEELIRHHKILYYRGAPEISDSAYDKLEDELPIPHHSGYVDAPASQDPLTGHQKITG